MIDRYDWAGGAEAMLRFGPDTGPVVVLAPPLLEEANRTRAFAVAMLRALAEQGIASALPDLPGTGESRTRLEDASLKNWQQAFSSAARVIAETRPLHLAAIRGGALLTHDTLATSRWQFAPVAGASLVRDLVRARQASAREAGETFDARDLAPPGPPVLLAGNRIGRALLAALDAAVPDATPPCRVIRLEGDAAPADRHVAGAPLWRRSEPGNDPALAALLAADLADWVRACAG